MCCLYGVIDYGHILTRREKDGILNCLAVAAEVRGTDATGIAYNSGGHLHIFKRPAAAHKLHLYSSEDARVIMGHTRMTTQGAARKNFNNHPFPGRTDGTRFAFAHNGVLHNDRSLRKNCKLPKSNIETDSYVAVQLLEKKNALDLDSLRDMAEQVRGSFVFTVLDERDNLYIVKGDNPLSMVELENGVILYASTSQILITAMTSAGIDYSKGEEIRIESGEILQLSPDGTRHRAFFDLPVPSVLFPDYRPGRYPTKTQKTHTKGRYRDTLVRYAGLAGVPEEEMTFLSQTDLTDTDLELAMYDEMFRESCLELYGYYGEVEDAYECFGYCPW